MAVMEEVNVGTTPAPFIDVSYLRSYDSSSFRQQREVRPRVPLSFESSILNVNSEGRYFRTNYGTNNGHSQGSNSRPYCDYCEKLGHTKARCYKLIGYWNGFYQGQQQLGTMQRYQNANANVGAINFAGPSLKRSLAIGRVRQNLDIVCSRCLQENGGAESSAAGYVFSSHRSCNKDKVSEDLSCFGNLSCGYTKL